MLDKIRQSVRTRHKLKLRWGILLRNIEDNRPLFWYTNNSASPWFSKLSETKDWLEALEESRLQGNVQRPDTKWVFDRAVSVDLKAILDRQPLRIGLGRLPAWLRNKREVIALDNYEDALCVFRCIAVHQGARPDRNARRTRQLAQSFLAAYPKILPPIAVSKLYWVEQHFKQGIAAYTVTQAGDFVLSHTPARYDKVGRPTMTIDVYGEHAFLITDINKVTNNYTCGDCGARFTFACNLARHAKTCSRGETKFDCPGNQILAPESAFEKAFYPESSFGFKAVCWLEYEAKQRDIHIHHQNVATGVSEPFLAAKSTVIIQKAKPFFSTTAAISTAAACASQTPTKGRTYSQLPAMAAKSHERTPTKRRRTSAISFGAMATVIERWEHELPRPWWNDRCPPKMDETYPHAIVYDFESYQDKTKASQPTLDLSFESEHVLISVSIADTLNPEPEDIVVVRDPNELLRLFYLALERRSDAIREDISQKYRPPDVEGLSEAQKKLIDQWCDQVPVLGFNSGHYDMELIRKYGQRQGLSSSPWGCNRSSRAWPP